MRKNLSGADDKKAIATEDELPELSMLIRQTKLRNRILKKITDKLNDPYDDFLQNKTKSPLF